MLRSVLLLMTLAGCTPHPVDEPAEPAPSESALPESEPEAPEPVSEPATEAECDRLAEAANAMLPALEGPCETAHDCVVVDRACPFGCSQVVSMAADAGPANAVIDAYFEQCRPCKNKCPERPTAVACAQGRCFASP